MKKRYVNVLPCPWCGAYPIAQPWHGGKPTKILIACDNEDCEVRPGITGETKARAMERWNKRGLGPVRVEVQDR